MTSDSRSAPLIHPSAVVDENVVLGERTKVWHFVHICSGAKIGKACVLGQNVYIGKDVRLGDGVKVQNNVSVYEGVEVEDHAFLGPSCVFTNVINPRAFIERKHEFRPTHVGRGASIGANATILCGVRLGDYCLIGAAAVVLTNVPAYAVVVGNPARQVGWICRCGTRLEEVNEQRCQACRDHYVIRDKTCHRIE
jgi:UDP-2-acetamido-3-amino-2,3-dideoxy-glucuronate N-acetyltransferase